MPSLSVIVPFYKDYAFVKQAVQSILTQRLSDVEVLIINDNPGDRTETFLKQCRFPEAVRVIAHETNSGLSAARNTGVRMADGDYIAYLDADDYFLPDGLRRHFRAAHTTRADVCHAVTAIREQRGTGRISYYILGRDTRFFRKTVNRTTVRDMPELQFIVSSWQSIYKAAFLKQAQIKFDEAQRKFEDRLYVLDTVFSQAQFSLTDLPTRIWRRRSNSITTSDKSPADIAMMAALIDKCTGLIESRTETLGLDDMFLQREVVHSLSRLLWELPVLDAALAEDEAAEQLRPVLTRSLSRAAPNTEIFSDPLAEQISRLGATNKRGRKITLDRAIGIWEGIAAGDWDRVNREYHVEATAVGAADAPSDSPADTDPEETEQVEGDRIEQTAGEQTGDEQVGIEPAAPAPSEPGPTLVQHDTAPAEPRQRFDDVRLIIHLGLHKTGSTHLQRNFVRQAESLGAASVLFPETGFTDHHDIATKTDATPGHMGLIPAIRTGNDKIRRALEEEVRASGRKTVLISCENLCFPYATQEDREKRVAMADTFFSAFPNRQIVSVIRRPDQYIESMYKERVVNPGSGEIRNVLEFVNEHRENLLNHAGMLMPWAKFANGNVTLLSYDRLRHEKDYFSAFCRELDLGLEPNTKKRGAKDRTYVSPSWDTIELLRVVATCVPGPDRKRRIFRDIVEWSQAQPRTGSGHSALSIDDRLDTIAEHESLCRAFFEEHGLDIDYPAIREDIEAHRPHWQPQTTLDYGLVEALLNSVLSVDSETAVRSKAQQRPGPSRRPAPEVVRNGRGLTIIKASLMPVYRNMPEPLRRRVQSVYRRIAAGG